MTGATAGGGAMLPLHSEPLRVAIIAENFLPKVDGSTITIANLLQHLKTTGVQAMLFGPESRMSEYAGARLFGTFGVPLRVYPGLKINFISPAFIRTLREFAPHVIHLVDPIWLGVQALAAIALLFPTTPVVTSHHTNLPTYAAVFGYPYYPHRTWQMHAYLHSFARCTLVPSASTAGLLAERGFANLRVVSRGVDFSLFDPALRSESLRQQWVAAANSTFPFSPPASPTITFADSTSFPFSLDPPPDPVIILSVGRLSREKNLSLIIDAVAALPPRPRAQSILVFVGDGPYRGALERRCAARGVSAVFVGHLSGRRLGEAFASGDVMCAPSLTETFGQTTLQGMAAGLPVAGLLAEGTADLVAHGHTGLLLDVRAAAEGRAPWAPLMPLGGDARVVGWGEAAPLVGEDAELPVSPPVSPPLSRVTSASGEEPPMSPILPMSPISPTFSASYSFFPSAGSASRANITARFACLLEVLILDAPLRSRMGRAGAQAARGGAYEWEQCAGRVVEAYAEAVGVSVVDTKVKSDAKAGEEPSPSQAVVLQVPVPSEGGKHLTSPPAPTDAKTALVRILARSSTVLSPAPSPSALLSTSSGIPPSIQVLLDGAVVLHALGLALMSHAAYMVPAGRDLRERGWWGGWSGWGLWKTRS